MSSSMLFNVTMIAYMVSTCICFAFLASRSKAVGLAGTYSALFGFLVQTVAIGMRW